MWGQIYCKPVKDIDVSIYNTNEPNSNRVVKAFSFPAIHIDPEGSPSIYQIEIKKINRKDRIQKLEKEVLKWMKTGIHTIMNVPNIIDKRVLSKLGQILFLSLNKN